MTRIKLKHVHRYLKGGRLYHYFRRGNVNIRLPGAPGSKTFMDAYAAALDGPAAPVGADKVIRGSMTALAADWYGSNGYTSLSASSQRTYRRLLEAFLADHGHRLVSQLEPQHLLRILAKMSATPAQANALRNVLRQLLQHGFDNGWRKDNPIRDVKRLKYAKKPFATWSEEDIGKYEARWPTGTRARLALALLLYTGQRRSDVIRMGPQHVRGAFIAVRQQKTGNQLEIPIHVDLRLELAEAPPGHLAFLMTELGKPFASGNAFYNWFMECAEKAGIAPGLSPHGLRKATCCRLAEAGCTPHEIAAVVGMSLKMVEHYTKGVNQRRLADAAVVRLGRPGRE
jgi:integrase